MNKLEQLANTLDLLKKTQSTNAKISILSNNMSDIVYTYFYVLFTMPATNISISGVKQAIHYKQTNKFYESLADYVHENGIDSSGISSYIQNDLSPASFIKLVSIKTGKQQIELVRTLLLQQRQEIRPWYVALLLRNVRVGINMTTFNKVCELTNRKPIVKRSVQLAKAITINDLDSLEYPVFVETKWDGIRCVLKYKDNNVTLFSRAFNDITNQFSDIVELFKDFAKLNNITSCELDGEITSSSFNSLQHRLGKLTSDKADKTLTYNVFDILMLNEVSTTEQTQLERSTHILQAFKDTKHIIMSKPKTCFNANEVKQLYKQIVDAGFEGIMLKMLSKTYEQTRNNWFKLKPVKDADVTIVDAYYGSGKYANKISRLKVIGNNNRVALVGSGITDSDREQLTKLFDSHELLGMTCEIQYQELTKTSYRFPRFIQLRYDK